MIHKNVSPIQLTDNDFDSFIMNSARPVLVDFWASWCAPCRMMEPVLEKFAQSQSSITVAKLNTEQNPLTPSKFQIFSIPTMILFEKGEEVHRLIGVKTLEGLEYELAAWLKIN
jgi:thioredoxin 1